MSNYGSGYNQSQGDWYADFDQGQQASSSFTGFDGSVDASVAGGQHAYNTPYGYSPEPNVPDYGQRQVPSSNAFPAPGYGGDMFYPQTNGKQRPDAGYGSSDYDFEDEPPLLEELGINFDHIKQKTMAVLNPLKAPDASAIHDNDLAGPLVFCLLFGATMLLRGKVNFGYVYGIGTIGCLAMHALLNLMSAQGLPLLCTVSILGYCILPLSLLSLLAALLSIQGIAGMCLAGAAILWCSSSSAKLIVTALAMENQQILVAYPCFLFYGVFSLLAIF